MVNSAGTVRETKALAKKFVRYKEGAELYSMGHSKFEQLAKEEFVVLKVKNESYFSRK